MSNRNAPAGRALTRLFRGPWLFQLVFIAGVIAFAAWRVNFEDVGAAFRDARYAWIALALFIYAVARIVHTFEWQITLTKVGRAPFGGLLGALLIGSLVNSVIPASAGDVAKVQIVANRYGLSRTGLITGRGAEGIVNGATLVIFLLISLALPATGFGSQKLLILLAVTTLIVFVAAAVGSNLMPAELPSWRVVEALPRPPRDAFRHMWPRFHAGLEVIRQPRLLLIAVVLNLFGWLVDLGILWSYGQAFRLHLPFAAYLSVTVAVAIVTIFPLTFGNIGTYELVLLRVLTLYDVPADRALAFAIGTHAIGTLFVMLLGGAAMAIMGIRPSELFSLRRSEERPAAEAVEADTR